LGQKCYNAKGQEEDALSILKSVGLNYVRLRIWNNPSSNTNNKVKVLEYAKHVKAKGLKLMVDFHYSDVWADPGVQTKPHQWANHDITQLEKDVYDYTNDVCLALKSQGTVPDSVQIGNEINTGMLWPEGKVNNNNFTNLGRLLKSGIKAIKDCNTNTQTIIHTADADSDANAKWFYDGIKSVGVNWDITGLSYYCYYHGSMANMEKVVADMKSRYSKPVIIAETSYMFEGNAPGSKGLCSGYSATPSGQANNFLDVQKFASNAGAIGVFYWEPTWLVIKGNGWDPLNINGTSSGWANQAMFNSAGHLNTLIKWQS